MATTTVHFLDCVVRGPPDCKLNAMRRSAQPLPKHCPTLSVRHDVRRHQEPDDEFRDTRSRQCFPPTYGHVLGGEEPFTCCVRGRFDVRRRY